jgi:hypothetical protein
MNYESDDDGSYSEHTWKNSQRVLRTRNVWQTSYTTMPNTNETSNRQTTGSTADIRGEIQKKTKKYR